MTCLEVEQVFKFQLTSSKGMYLSRSKRAPAWFQREGETLLLPPIVSIKHLCKATKLPLNAIVKGFTNKNGKSFWYRVGIYSLLFI